MPIVGQFALCDGAGVAVVCLQQMFCRQVPPRLVQARALVQMPITFDWPPQTLAVDLPIKENLGFQFAGRYICR